jgi:hypothetical protein
MKNPLQQLEQKISQWSESSALSKETLSKLPVEIQKIHRYKLFGDDLLAIPAEVIFEGDEDESEHTFQFTDDDEAFSIFESEYRELVPEKFIQIGMSFGTDIVLLDTKRGTIHKFHVADVVDEEMMEYHLETELTDLKTFLSKLRPQSVACFIDPKNASKYEMLQINGTNVVHDGDIIETSNNEEARSRYTEIARKCLEKGYELHYAPKWLKISLGK